MKKLLYILPVLAITFVACDKNKDDDKPDFDKGSLLVNVADNIIIPRLNDFELKINDLELAYQDFQSDMTQTKLDVLRTEWQEAYVAWQYIKTYNFGPIMSYGFKASTGTFPTDTTLVNSNISSGSYDLNTAANIDAIGLSSLDYLLYKSGALNYFINDANYSVYVGDVIAKLVTETAAVSAAWVSYRSTFVNSTGTEATSAFSQLVNEFNLDYEIAKNAKLGIPIGKQSLGIQMPEYIEARYSGISFTLLQSSIDAIHKLYEGISLAGSNGPGFDDYLNHLERQTLNSTIKNNFGAINTKISSFSNSLETEMTNDPAGLDELYNLIQGQVVNLKTDMTSAFGVLITYQDNDGD